MTTDGRMVTQHEGTATLAAFAAAHGFNVTRQGFVEAIIDGCVAVVEWRAKHDGFEYGARWNSQIVVAHWRWRDTPEDAARPLGWRPAGEAPDAPTPEAAPAPASLTDTYRDGCRDLLAQLEAMQAERDAARRERDNALARLDDANRRLAAVKAVFAAAMEDET